MRSIRHTRFRNCIGAALVALMCLLLSAFVLVPASASAKDLVYDYQSKQDGSGVSDPTTKIDITKLDSRSHDAVEGAVLAILDADGKELVRWTSDGTTKHFDRFLQEGVPLNVEQEYILREISAPDHYDTAPDTHFIIGKFGTVTIKEGSAAETTSKYALNLYDTMQPQYVDEYLEEHKGDQIEEEKGGKDFWENMPITGDQAIMLLVALGVIVVAIVVIVIARRKSREERDRE